MHVDKVKHLYLHVGFQKVPHIPCDFPLTIQNHLAGVTTAVGGHTRGDDSDQFTISDDRSVADMAHMLESMGYQPIYKDWQQW